MRGRAERAPGGEDGPRRAESVSSRGVSCGGLQCCARGQWRSARKISIVSRAEPSGPHHNPTAASTNAAANSILIMSESIRGISGGKTASRGGRGGRGRGGAATAQESSADEPPQQSPPHQQQQQQPASARSSAPSSRGGSVPFSARGGRGGSGAVSARLTHTALSGLDASSSSLPSTVSGAGSGAPLSTSLARQPSNVSEMSTTSSMAPHPDCLLCCFPIASYTLSTCQHSAQICGTCIVRVQLFIKKGKKDAASSSSAAPGSSASPPPVAGNDLLNDANDFRPSAEALALAESKKWHCPYCQADWSLVLITREYDIHSSDPRLAPPPTSSFGLSTDASKYPLHRWVFDSTLNVYFENEQTRQKYQMMQSIYCVLCYNLTDAFAKGGNPKKRFDHVHFYATTAALEEHLEKSHQRFLCTACVATRKIFMAEHQIFTRKELLHHFQFGSNEKTVTEYEPQGHTAGIIEPHSWCQFCNKPFFTSDELYVHLTTDHRSCRFCESEGFSRYFRTDAALRAHFAQKHYVCEIGACKKLDANHAGFRDQLAGRAHVLAAHADTLSKEQMKKLSTIDLDFFRSGPSASRMAGGASQGRHNGPKQVDEFEFRADSPPRVPGASAASSSSAAGFSGFDEYFETQEEDFPSLAGGSGAGASSSSRAIPRSHSQPMMAGAAAQLFGGSRREEAFPSLSSASSSGPGVPLAHASGPGTATETGFRVRGPPPPKSEFPTLHSVAKQEAKQAKKADEKKAQQQQTKKPQQAKEPQQTKAPSPTPSPPPVQDTRTISSVPLPLPSPAPASEMAARNKALVVTVKTALRGDPDSFESFKTLSQRFRAREISCEKYLQRFTDLFARNPAGAADTERLLMELVALLPDDAQRQELHQEYARQKVMATVAKMKEKQAASDVAAAAAGPSAASVVAVSSSAAAPAPVAAPKARGSSAAAPSFAAAARAAPSDSFTVVLSSHDAKDSKAAAKRAAAAQGIGAFEGVAVKPLKRDDDEPTDFLSAIAKEAEKREREAAAAAKNDSSSSKPPPGMKKSGWGDGSALAGPSGRPPPGLAAPASLTQSSSSPALSTLSRQNSNNSNSWAALDGENGEEEVAEQSAAPRKQKVPRRPATPPSDDDAAPISDPPLQSSSSSSGPVVVLPEPSELESHVLRISALRIAPREKSSLELLALIFQHLSSLIQSRHGAVNSAANRRFHMGEQARQGLTSLMKQTRFGHALEFSRAARLGLLPGSVTLLNGVVGMHSRFGGELLGEQLASTLAKLSSSELFLMLEYTHAVLVQLTKPSHPDLKELQASFAADEARRAQQNEQFKGVPIKEAPAAGAGAEATSWRSNAAADGGEDAASGGGGGGKKKKGKQLLYRL